RAALHAESRLGWCGGTAARAAPLERGTAAHAEARARRVLGAAALARARHHVTTLPAHARCVERLLLRPEVFPAPHLPVVKVEKAADRDIHLDAAPLRDHVDAAPRENAPVTEVLQLEL